MLRRGAQTDAQRAAAALRREKTAAEDRARRLRQLERWSGPELDDLLATWRSAAREVLDALRSHVDRCATGGAGGGFADERREGPAATDRQIVRAAAGLRERDALDVLGDDFFSQSEEEGGAEEDEDSECKRKRTDDW